MQLPKRALVYGILAWAVWMPTVMGLMMGLPDAFIASRVGQALPGVLLMLSILIFGLLYLRKVRKASWREGALVGLVWMVIFVIFDIAHYALFGPVDLGAYFSTFFIGYFILPVTVGLLFQFTEAKK